MDNVTRELTAYAKRKGITVKAIAENTGLPYQPLWSCFRGKRALRGDELLSVCEYLEKDPRDFAQPPTQPPAGGTTEKAG